MAGVATEKSKVESQSQSGASTNNSGIPAAVFVEDVDEFMLKPDNTNAEQVIRRLDEQHQKYKFMELNLNTKKKRLQQQLPDIKNTLDAVQHLQSNRTEKMETNFMLSDQLYVKAKIPPTEKVCLWLGANIMLEYSLDEAATLLQKNLGQAKSALIQVDEDLGYLRDQTTTTEVSMARIYNWDVRRRQAEKAAGAQT